jgi:hypothetical protein
MAEIQLPPGPTDSLLGELGRSGEQVGVLRVLAEPVHDVRATGTDLPFPSCGDIVHGALHEASCDHTPLKSGD